jgi:hypothetical protein
MVHVNRCQHRFEQSRLTPFIGAEEARFCEVCEHAEVLVDGCWVSYERYLDERRSRRRHSELAKAPSPAQRGER